MLAWSWDPAGLGRESAGRLGALWPALLAQLSEAIEKGLMLSAVTLQLPGEKCSSLQGTGRGGRAGKGGGSHSLQQANNCRSPPSSGAGGDPKPLNVGISMGQHPASQLGQTPRPPQELPDGAHGTDQGECCTLSAG